jgi:hypothetical protein
MITTRVMPTLQPSFLGVSPTITAGHKTDIRLCRGPGIAPVFGSVRRAATSATATGPR